MTRPTACTVAVVLLVSGAAHASDVQLRVRQRGDGAPIPELQLAVDGVVTPIASGDVVLDLPDGQPVVLDLSSPLHAAQSITVTAPLDKPLRIWLKALPGSPEIVVEAFRPTSDVSRHRVDAEMAYETPGTYDDAVRLVQALPGVNVQREYAPSSGEVSVRGSLPGDNRYYLDGIEVPYLYHFNQYASVFPASQLDTLDLYASGFGAKFGDSTGAIVEAISDTRPPTDVTGSVSLNYVTVGAQVRAPLKKGWWLGASARRSFQDLVTRQTQQFPLWPRFYDFTARAELVREHDTFAIYATGAGDRYDRRIGELDVLDPVETTLAPSLSYGRDYQVAGFRYDWRGGRLSSAVIHDDLRGTINVGGEQKVRTISFPTRVDAHGRIDDRLSWEAGAELRSEIAQVSIASAGAFGALVTAEAPATAWGVDASETLVRSRLGAYGELHAQMGPVRLIPGVRVGIDTAGWEPLVEPRLTARFRVADQTELRIGTGRYQQRPETVQLAYDPDLPTTNAWQLTGGIDQTFANRLELVLEGYGKWLDHVIWQPVNGPPAVAEKGTAFGGELTLRYRLREQFFLWAWFAAGRAFLDDGDRVFPSQADQPLSGGLVASWNILPPLNVAVRYRVASGLPFTDVASSVYDGALDTWLPRYGPANGDRMPLYQKIDVHLAYTIPFRRWSLAISADVWIVPKSAAQLYPTWNYDYSERGFVVGPTVVPLFGLRASF